MTANQQNLVSLIIIIITIMLVGWMAHKPQPDPTGLVSLSEATKPVSPFTIDQVKVYQTLPAGSQVVGEVTAELALNPNAKEQEQVQTIMNYVRARAGAAGANAVVIEMIAQRGQVLYVAAQLATV